MNMIVPPAIGGNARADYSEVDPLTWVLLAEEALEQGRTEQAETLIEEAFRAYDERRTILSGWCSSPLEKMAEANA